MSGNTDKAAGMANQAAGKVKQGVGKAVGSDKLRGEGAGQEAKGDAQQLKGDAKNAIKHGANKAADAANKKLYTFGRSAVRTADLSFHCLVNVRFRRTTAAGEVDAALLFAYPQRG